MHNDFISIALTTIYTMFVMVFIAPDVLWPYVGGITILVVGLAMLFKHFRHRLGEIRSWGPLFYAIPLAVFGAQHFTATRFVAQGVPQWMPWHVFWIYLVGIALFAAALSLVTGVQTKLAAPLLGVMLLSFVFLLHIPNYISSPHDRVRFAVLLRDLAFSGGAFALAAKLWDSHKLAIVARFFVAVPLIVFGGLNILHPELVPAVPLVKLTPLWIPLHLLWDYLTGVIFIIAALCLFAKFQAKRAATWTGGWVFLMILLIYLPITIASPADIANAVNYFADTLMFSGTLLLLADAMNN